MNIFHRKRDKMRPSEQTMNDFLNIMPAVLYEYAQSQDGSGEVRYISPTSLEILGYSSEYFLGDVNIFFNLIHPDDRARIMAEDKETVNDSDFATDARIILPSGEIKWIRMNSKPSFKTDDGTVVWCGCIIDITSLKIAEKEINTLHGILPICCYCKKIRDGEGLWNQLEEYIHSHSTADFSHSICPECMEKHHPDI